jgi:outer membrane protein TolC
MSVVIADTPQPIHGPDGNVTAYLVPAAELDRLRAEAEAVRQERDHIQRQLMALLPKATPEEEAEMKHLMETAIPDGLDHLIAELEAEGYPDGRR